MSKEKPIEEYDSLLALFQGKPKEKAGYEEIKNAEDKRRLNMRGMVSDRYYKMVREAQKHNLPIMSKNAFIKFSLDSTKDFTELYEKYRQYRYKRYLMPVVQLVDRKKGYVAGNFLWMTIEDKVDAGIPVRVISESGQETVFPSVKEAERQLKLPSGVLYRPLRKGGKYKKLKVMYDN